MIYLTAVSLTWALSFGLIKGSFSEIDPFILSFLRLGLSFILFLPFARIQRLSIRLKVQLIFLGMVQYGIMYLLYIASYRYLESFQVAILTIMTPLFVTIIADIFDKKFRFTYLLLSLLSILGAAFIMYDEKKIGGALLGITLMQLSNICFAFGQVYYRRIMKEVTNYRDHRIYALPFFGAVLVTFLATVLFSDWSTFSLNTKGWVTLIYLGIIASGACSFFWNYGATKVSSGVLAVINNLKIPLAVFASLFIFGESAPLSRLLVGGAMILVALIVAKNLEKKT